MIQGGVLRERFIIFFIFVFLRLTPFVLALRQLAVVVFFYLLFSCSAFTPYFINPRFLWIRRTLGSTAVEQYV